MSTRHEHRENAKEFRDRAEDWVGGNTAGAQLWATLALVEATLALTARNEPEGADD
jgi:hypothetical protein